MPFGGVFISSASKSALIQSSLGGFFFPHDQTRQTTMKHRTFTRSCYQLMPLEFIQIGIRSHSSSDHGKYFMYYSAINRYMADVSSRRANSISEEPLRCIVVSSV